MSNFKFNYENLRLPAVGVIFVLSNFKYSIMKQQRVITVGHRVMGIDRYSFNLDSITSELNRQGWEVKQIVSTSFKDGIGAGQQYPVIIVTLLVEKA